MRQVRQKAVEGPPVPIAFVHSKTARSCFHNVYLPVVGTRPFHPVHWLSGRFTCDRCASQARSAPTSTTLGTPTNSTCLSAARYRRLQGLSRTSEGCCAGATATAARHARESSTRAAEPRGGHGGRTGNHRSVPHRLDRPAVTRSAALSSPSSLHSMARLRRTAPVKQRLEGAPTLLDLMRSAPQPGSLTGRRRADSLVQVSAFPRIHRHALHD